MQENKCIFCHKKVDRYKIYMILDTKTYLIQQGDKAIKKLISDEATAICHSCVMKIDHNLSASVNKYKDDIND